MNIEQAQALTDGELLIAIDALAGVRIVMCNKKLKPSPDGRHRCIEQCEGGGWTSHVAAPDYVNDLNAMHACTSVTAKEAYSKYGEALQEVVGAGDFIDECNAARLMIESTAKHRAIAFVVAMTEEAKQ